MQHARPASIAYLDEEEKTVDVIFADTAAGEEAGAATETGAGAAASSAAGAAAGAAGAAEEEEDEELLPSEEDGVPAWRVWTVGTLPVRGALDNDGQHEEEVGSENGVVAGAGSSAEPVRWASPKRRPEAVCSEAEAESALDLYRACLMNAARCNAFNKQWADVDALASQVVALRPTDAAAFLLRAKARLALAWLPQAAHDLKLCERLAAEDPGTLRKVAKVRESLKSRRRHAKAHGRRAIKQILQYVDTVQMGAGEGKGEDGPSGAAM